jgi:hypothetical protein
VADPARGHQLLGRTRQQQEKRAPVLDAGAVLDRQLSDEAFVEQ